MLTAARSNKRHPIPRWRELRSVIEAKELAMPPPLSPVMGHKSPELLERLEKWRAQKGVIEAAELVETATVTGDDVDALKAAQFLVEAEGVATLMVRKNAALMLQRNNVLTAIPIDIKQHDLEPSEKWRSLLRMNPRDALAWVELARLQVSKGLATESAKRSMSVAVALAPNDRHVLRAAARLYVHLDDPERAYALIRRNEATPHDPWLLAAEVALADLIEKDTKFYKAATSMLDGMFSPRHLSELASALGSHLLRDGRTKKSKKLLRQSLVDPNGNSLAQAVWASDAIGEALISDRQLQKNPDSSEARARKSYWDGDYSDAFADAMKWIMEEPISTKAYVGAISAACQLEDYVAAQSQAERGLQHDPTSAELLLGGAFAAACLNAFDLAEQYLAKAEAKATDHQKIIITADRGLIAIRRGDSAEGIAQYRRAIAGFGASGSHEAQRLCRAYFAREAVLARLPEASKIVQEVAPKKGERLGTDAEHVLSRALYFQAQQQVAETGSASPAQSSSPGIASEDSGQGRLLSVARALSTLSGSQSGSSK